MKKIFLTITVLAAAVFTASAQQESPAKTEREITKINKATVQPATLPTKTYNKPDAESAPETKPATSPEVNKKEVEPVKRNVRQTPKAVRNEKPVEKQELKKD